MSAPLPVPTEEPRLGRPTDPEAPLRELAAKYPEPDWKQTAVDRFWLADYQATGALDAHIGKVVAVLDKQVIGIGDNYITMLLGTQPQVPCSPPAELSSLG